MNSPSAIDQTSFRRILARNVTLPLAVGVATAALFIALIAYLLSVLGWVEHTERVIGNANETIKLSVDLETGMRGFIITGNESFLAPYKLGKPKISAEMDSLNELVSDNAVQIDRLKRIRALQTQWDAFATELIALRRQNGNVQEILQSGRGKLEFDEIRKEFNAFLDMEQRLRKERNDEARSVTLIVVGGYLFFTLLLSGLLAVSGRRELLRLSATYNDALEQHTQHAELLQQQAWVRTGQTQLGEQIIGQLALQQLGGKVLEFLAQYIKLAVGALYVRDVDGGLRRIAAYGFSKESEQADQAFYHNEGLVGQAASARRMIRLTDIPENYLKVASGLGSGKPLQVALVPIENDGKVNGILELGFMGKLADRELEFLQLVSASIGAAVEAAQYRQRLQDLLAETQQLNEELQVQQEELRTANEELEEQSRALEESQANLENQKAELEQNNEQLASQALMLDQKNAALNEAQTQLEARAEDLQRASRYKSEFLANMSHELRTPLNSSLILAKLLSDNQHGNLNEEQVKFAQTIYSAGNDLLNLINDILDISKVEAGKLELVPENLQLSRLAESLKATFAPLAAQKKLNFSMDIAPAAPKTLFTDQQRLQQILKNLLSNAIKFTDNGEIGMDVALQEDGRLSFAVKDSGIGIRQDQQDVIFEAFQQADGTTSRRYGGTGLGLSISRDLARLLGGEIRVSSVPGKGSTFTLFLPVQWSAVTEPEAPVASPAATAIALPVPEPAAYAAAPAPSLPFEDDRQTVRGDGRSVLVIEDETAFASILYELAHELKYRCLVAQGAEEGLQMAAQFLPDAILLDMVLPDRSGLDVLQQLKANPRTRHIPVHVVSATDRNEAALHLGAIGYATKPTTREQLKNVFLKLEDKLTQKVKRILLVEDDARQRDSVMQLISDPDIEITAVALGEEALAMLRTTTFDCMIIDLKLPDIQGNELLQRMSSEDICSFPPVIVYTGRNLTREEEHDLLKYSRSIIIKGARSPERLLDEVTLFLHKVESELSVERQGMLKTVRSRDRLFEGRRILLVDDDVRNIFALSNALEQKGVTVEIGRNGFEAISQLDALPDIDLVLMDVMMPGMDGLEATRQIRKDPRFQKLPIIAITAKAMKDDQEQCMKAGASDYLAKPIDLDRLYSLLRVWMPKMERI
ncbi:response regulator [Undibacterium sp. TJN25]|uniref:response regulator n=1 Tax=Undibacterium sp. TJN25 TaxID=3413056 RepID=UPI003BEF6D82